MFQELKELIDELHKEAEAGISISVSQHYELLGLKKKLEAAASFFKDNGFDEKV